MLYDTTGTGGMCVMEIQIAENSTEQMTQFDQQINWGVWGYGERDRESQNL